MDYVPPRLSPAKRVINGSSYSTLIKGLKLNGFQQGYNPACGSCTPIYYLVQSLVVPLAAPFEFSGLPDTIAVELASPVWFDGGCFFVCFFGWLTH